MSARDPGKHLKYDIIFAYDPERLYTVNKYPPRPLCSVYSAIHEANGAKFPGVTLDECQYIENADNVSNMAMSKIPMFPKRKRDMKS